MRKHGKMTIRMAYEMVMPYHLHMPSYFLETFTEYPYVNSLRSPIQAKYDKATFQKGGKVPEERIRDYLAAAGWKCVQPELWEKT